LSGEEKDKQLKEILDVFKKGRRGVRINDV